MKITSYHGLVENTSIHCDDSGIQALFTDLVGGLKGTRTWMLQAYETFTLKANVIIEWNKNLVLSSELTKVELHRERFRKLKFRPLALRQSEYEQYPSFFRN